MKSFCKSNYILILSAVLLVFGSVNTFAVTELTAVKISGGEDHTLVLGSNYQVFGCGANYRSFSNRASAVLGFTPQAFDHAINSIISTRLLEVSQL